MKTKHLKLATITSMGLLALMLFSMSALNAQEDGKKTVKISKVTNVNGNETIIDTTFEISSLEDLDDIEAIKDLLGEDFNDLSGLEDLDLDFFITEGDLEGEGKYIITLENEDMENGDGFVFVTSDNGTQQSSVDGKSYVFIEKDGAESSERTISISSGDDLEWTSDRGMNVQVEDTGNGHKKVTVNTDDGETREYMLEEGKGIYMIGEDGELQKVEDENRVEWNANKDGDQIWITVEEDDDGNVTVYTGNDENVDLKNNSKNNRIIIEGSDPAVERDVQVNVIRKDDGNETIVIKKSIVVKKLNQKDIDLLKDAGVNIEQEKGENQLELDDLQFSPNPNDGKFTLNFSTPEKGTTEIRIFDAQGKEVYHENIENFNGLYNKQIDISNEKQGTYFLSIRQGDRVSTRKILLD
ncbi:MAG: T9SS type A sorting domain-containing protein [Bacteroidales bacterium]|nr:T9SS type A sorting domain-containing protein [Bacteroidales bacterium]